MAPLPDLKEGVIGDLVVPYCAVLDPKAPNLFSEERKIPLFKKEDPAVCPASSRDVRQLFDQNITVRRLRQLSLSSATA